jgi:hypothetical protein
MRQEIEALVDRIAEVADGALPPALAPDPARWRREAIAALRDLLGGDEAASLLPHLKALGAGALADGLGVTPGGGVLLGELALNLADPGRINQGRKGTCAPTCVETYLAVREPVEYARIVAGLAAPAGVVTLADGSELVRDGDAPLHWTEAEGRRSPVSRLFQVAAMEASSTALDYDDARDSQVADDGSLVGTGLDLAAFDHLIEAATGAPWGRWSRSEYGFARMLAEAGFAPPLELAAVLAAVDRALEQGDFAFATLAPSEVDAEAIVRAMGGVRVEGAEGGPSLHAVAHKVRIVDVDAEAGIVRFDDPLDPAVQWLGEGAVLEDDRGTTRMPIASFLACVADLSLREEHWPHGQ